MTTKVCTKCLRDLPVAMFNRAKWIASGLRSDCKECYSALKKRMWASKPLGPNTERSRELRALKLQGLRRCRVCSEVKPLDEDNFATGGVDTTCRPCARRRTRAWAADNPERAKTMQYANCAARYAAKRQRTPPWLTKEHREQIRAIYAECRRLIKTTGIKHHVDHIVPLVGRIVSGLHVPWNLQIITAHQNVTKSNKWVSA